MIKETSGYVTPQMNVIVFADGDVFCDKVSDSMTGSVDNSENIGIDNGDHTGPDGGWNSEIEVD